VARGGGRNVKEPFTTAAIPALAFHEVQRNVNERLRGMEAVPIDDEEFLSARMYTGPMYVKYNSVLRGLQSTLALFRSCFERLCRGNKYSTTLHCINSAVVKLSKSTIASKVYRGVSGGRLPHHFRVANEFGVRGGIDPAFMSTTLDREVALAYASTKEGPGVVFEIQQGMIDRGADISWLSQYPHEKEILFAPLCGLEIMKLTVDGTVLVPLVRLSINLNAATIDQVISRRRKLLIDMGTNMSVEVSAALSGTGFEEVAVKMLSDQLHRDALAQPVMWYNVEEHFQEGVARVIDAKRAALSHEKRLGWMMTRPSALSTHALPIVRLLRDEAPSVRRAALEAIGAMEAHVASPHTSSVVPCLRDVDESVRQACVEALFRVDSASLSAATPSIILILEHSSQQPSVRCAAIKALGHLDPGKLAQCVKPAVVSRLSDDFDYVRTAALEAMAVLEGSMLLAYSKQLLICLEDAIPEVRNAAVATLSSIAPYLPLNAIVARLDHRDDGVRQATLALLAKLEPHLLTECAAILVRTITDPSEHVRSAALEAIASLHPSDLATHREAVLQCFSDASAEVRGKAIESIAKLHHDPLMASLPQLLASFTDHDPGVRGKAVSVVLSRLDVSELIDHIGEIVRRIEDDDAGVRRAAMLWATAKLGPSLLGRHSRAVARGLDDSSVSVRRAAIDALTKLGPLELTAFANPIVLKFTDEILSVRLAAVRALSKLPSAALAPHAHALTERFKDPEWSVRAAALCTLGSLGTALREYLPIILTMIEDAFDGVRSAAVDVILSTGLDAIADHGPAIAQRLDHPKAGVKVAALSLLASLPTYEYRYAYLSLLAALPTYAYRAACTQLPYPHHHP